MASKATAIATVVLRIFTILLAAGSVVVLILDKATDVDGSKLTFKNVTAYRYVLATDVVAAAYCLLQLPFAICYACTEKRLLRGDFLPAFDFYGDKLIAFLMATSVGAGFLVTVELKEFLGDLFKEFGKRLKFFLTRDILRRVFWQAHSYAWLFFQYFPLSKGLASAAEVSSDDISKIILL